MTAYLAEIRQVVHSRTLTALLAMSLLVTVLEAASISAVIPAMAVILGDTLPASVATAMQALGIGSPTMQVMALSGGVALVFLLRGVLLGLITWLQSRIVFRTQARLSGELFARFMTARFERLTDIASASLVRASTTELSNLTLGVLLPLVAFVSEAALIAGSLMVLLAVQPRAALTLLAVTVVLTAPLVLFNRRRLGQLGQTRHDMEDDRVRLAQEVVGGVREIHVYDLKSQIADAVERTNASYAHVMTRINFLTNLPRIYLETLGVCALLVTCAIQLALGRSGQEVVMFLTMSAFAAFRALPSVAKLLAQWQALRFYRPSLASYLGLMARLEPAPASTFAADTRPEPLPGRRFRVSARRAGYRHAADSPEIFSGMDFELESGQIVGLTGPSGAGKSTLLDCLIGLRHVTAGELRVLDARSGTPLQCRIAYVPQTPVMLDGTLGRNITLAPKGAPEPSATDPRLADALALSGLDQLMRERGLTLASRVVEGGRNLSGGQRQRLALARALHREADILILDEATSALDADAERRILDGIRARDSGQLVIMVTHRTELLAFCDTTVEILLGGRVTTTRASAVDDVPHLARKASS
jgi:ABC-type multidrug transport system fused ATPase/permease subunit